MGKIIEEKTNMVKLFEEENEIQVIFGLKKLPTNPSMKPRLITVPHPLISEPSYCLIIKEPYKQFKELLELNPIESLKKVIGLDKLRKRYSTYKLKRDLCSEYDIFLCDERILPFMTKLLGKV